MSWPVKKQLDQLIKKYNDVIDKKISINSLTSLNLKLNYI